MLQNLESFSWYAQSLLEANNCWYALDKTFLMLSSSDIREPSAQVPLFHSVHFNRIAVKLCQFFAEESHTSSSLMELHTIGEPVDFSCTKTFSRQRQESIDLAL